MPSSFELEPGDVLSYSAGSTQTGPEGFRKLHDRPGLLSSALQRWPDIGDLLAGRVPLVINAYPATVGAAATGVTIDTYLSPRVMTRALQLGAVTEKPVILCGQSLFLADALLAHIGAERALAKTMLIMIGGYTTPHTLEQALRTWLAPQVRTLEFLQGYGVAEVDAGCMMARERDDAGRLIYHPRTDVDVELDGDELLLSLRGPDGERIVDRWRTGDSAERSADGYAIWNHRRCHPDVHAELESWTEADWRRRTGYVRREDQRIWIQLRQGVEPRAELELDYWDFGRAHGFAWLDKPYWR
jgi:hypothetical protein